MVDRASVNQVVAPQEVSWELYSTILVIVDMNKDFDEKSGKLLSVPSCPAYKENRLLDFVNAVSDGLKKAKSDGLKFHLEPGLEVRVVAFDSSNQDTFNTHCRFRKWVARSESIAIVCSRFDEPACLAQLTDGSIAALWGKLDATPKSSEPLEHLWMFAQDPHFRLVHEKSSSREVIRKCAQRSIWLSRGSFLVRRLTHESPQVLNPAAFAAKGMEWAEAAGLKTKFYSYGQLKKMGAGGFCGVSRGSADESQLDCESTPRGPGILRVDFPGSCKDSESKSPIVLVGKGVTFDSGGLALKSPKSMREMHQDMNGAAVALSSVLVAQKLDYDRPVTAYLALCENSIGPNALRPSEIVEMLDGTTVEIAHPDAEGRLILADTLVLAEKQNPYMIIDYATLTGAAIGALGSRYSAGFTNKNSLNNYMMRSGKTSGERVWPFPMDSDYKEGLKSKRARILQCTVSGPADHILAAQFLGSFVKSPWVHLDLSASESTGGLGAVDDYVTGFGLRLTDHFIQSIADHLEKNEK